MLVASLGFARFPASSRCSFCIDWDAWRFFVEIIEHGRSRSRRGLSGRKASSTSQTFCFAISGRKCFRVSPIFCCIAGSITCARHGPGSGRGGGIGLELITAMKLFEYRERQPS